MKPPLIKGCKISGVFIALLLMTSCSAGHQNDASMTCSRAVNSLGSNPVTTYKFLKTSPGSRAFKGTLYVPIGPVAIPVFRKSGDKISEVNRKKETKDLVLTFFDDSGKPRFVVTSWKVEARRLPAMLGHYAASSFSLNGDGQKVSPKDSPANPDFWTKHFAATHLHGAAIVGKMADISLASVDCKKTGPIRGVGHSYTYYLLENFFFSR